MSGSKLALHGGTPVNPKPFVWNYSIGPEETEAVARVMESRVLSDYYGSPGSRFLGGVEVRRLEEEWAARFGVKHAMAVNSASSGLYCAVAALGLEPGDEVIVPPYTMSATVAAVVANQCLPVFADIEEDCFCLEPASVEQKITPRTKAVLAVDLFGQPADLKALGELCRKHGLSLLEDNAQAPGARHLGRYAGTVGRLGVFSLNVHKAIQCGEGGVVVTDDDDLAERVQLIRNHAEGAMEAMRPHDPAGMVGFNFRMTELGAAVSSCQLKKLESRNREKIDLAAYLTEKLAKFDFLTTPRIRPGCDHVYYLYVLKYDPSKLDVPRDAFIRALNAEGYSASLGYVTPNHLLPMFRDKKAYGIGHHPWSLTPEGRAMTYGPGDCPVCEGLENENVFYPNLIRYKIGPKDIDRFAQAVAKVADQAGSLVED